MNASKVATHVANRQCRKCVIVTADDFGLNSEVNEAIEALHREGLVTQASLMVNETGVDEALRIARRNPNLVVGLHLSLCCGRASKPSLLTDSLGRFVDSPAVAGLRYAFDHSLRPALSEEIATQFEKFATLGFPSIYWDGHTHLHLHPTILNLTLPVAVERGFQAIRLVREPGYTPLPVIFRMLSHSAAKKLTPFNIRYTNRIFGLQHTGRMVTRQFTVLLSRIKDGWTEIYCHPGAESGWIDGQSIARFAESSDVRLGTMRDLIAKGETGG